MNQNNVYNLMTQVTQEAKSLWRIKNNYLADAQGDDALVGFWQQLADDKEKHIEDLKQLIKEHLK